MIAQELATSNNQVTAHPSVPRYRVKRDFDDIDKGDFRDSAFAIIKDYFQRATEEIDLIDGLRGRFYERGGNSFGATVINSAQKNGTAHITVHHHNTQFSISDIYYSFSENAPHNTANGGFNVLADEYEQYLISSINILGTPNQRLSPHQAADFLWTEFINKAGITYD